jgi:serine/threonine protein phosphatase 1
VFVFTKAISSASKTCETGRQEQVLVSIFAIGDIHGCSLALEMLLSVIPLQEDDTLVTLGDYEDRGPDTPGVFERLLRLEQEYHLVALRGNHDEMMLNAQTNRDAQGAWEINGGTSTLDSYGSMSAVPNAHWQFLEHHCVDFWECETHFFVHGSAYPNVPLWEQPVGKLHWGSFNDVQPHEAGKVMVCGHTSQKNGRPADKGYAVCLDTYVYGSGWLSCLDVGQGMVWQTNQRQQMRWFALTASVES